MKGRARKMQETTIEVTPEVEQLIQKAARAAVAEYKRQEEKESKRDKYHNTFTLMKCYRDAALKHYPCFYPRIFQTLLYPSKLPSIKIFSMAHTLPCVI